MSAVRSCSVRREFWRQVGAGRSTVAAAASVGVSRTTGECWFLEAGGMPPLSLHEPRPGSGRLTIAEREKIHAGIHQGRSIRSIAAEIGRAASTVMRELDRNMFHQHYSRRPGTVGRPRTTAWNYSPHAAQRRAEREAARPKTAKLAANADLRAEVQARLEAHHSPEQIANRLREDFPDDPEMWVSHETIYASIYVQGRGALNRELARCLRTGRALRKPRRRAGARQDRIPDKVMISERPPEAADRAVPGHWEGDLIVGKNSASAIGTLVERATGFTMLLHLPHRHGAVEVQEAMITAMSQLSDELRKSVTWDQGIEMANHTQITLATDVKIYFCDPASPWQRGVNENTNGLLRQYFPKGTDLSGYHPDYLRFVANQLNERPRKRLGWRTPKEALRDLLSTSTDPPGVALTG